MSLRALDSAAFGFPTSCFVCDPDNSRGLGLSFFHDGCSGAPILDQAVGYLDCQVRDRLPVGGHTLFVGEVLDARFQKAEDTPVLRMEDTRMNYGG